MKKLVLYFLSSILMVSTVACSTAKTSSDAPNEPEDQGGQLSPEDAQENAQDATNEVRQKQIESDKRAIDQRNNAAGDTPQDLADNDLASLVRNKLETALPTSQLAVESKEGMVTVSGKVASAEDLSKLESLIKEVQGVKGVDVKATVATP